MTTCPQCSLLSMCEQHCQFCQERIEVTDTHTHMCTHSISPAQNRKPVALQCLLTVTGMPAPTTKADWIARLNEAGIHPPKEWNLIQIKAAWAEYTESVKETNEANMHTEIAAMKRASRKKASLQEFLEENQITFNKSDTMAVLFAKGEAAIMKKFPPTRQEKVGFGKHADLTMQEVTRDHPDYVRWCRTTVAEAEMPFWRMERLVQYDNNLSLQPTKTMPKSSKEVALTASKSGYAPAPPPHVSNWDQLEAMKATAKAKALETAAASQPVIDMDSDEEKVRLRQKIAALEAENSDLHRQTARNKGRREM